MQAQAAIVTSGLLRATGDAVDAARDQALGEVESRHPVRGPERSAALDAEAGRWTPLGASLDAMRDVLIAWADALELAALVNDDRVVFESVVPLVARLVLLYDDATRIAQSLGLELPELPPLIRSAATLPGGR